MSPDLTDPRPAWFVGAMYEGGDDQTPRFVSQGMWENGFEDKLFDQVRSMQPGDRIAIKSTFVRKHDLPFDNHGHPVSVMAIKATGVITENLGDGRHVKVAWTPVDPPREWYFYTFRGTVWRVLPDMWRTQGLIAFAFDGAAQDIDRFRNEPYWKGRFGDRLEAEDRFAWTQFYEELATGLLRFRFDRRPLVNALREFSERTDELSVLRGDRYTDTESGFVRDIDPFSTMGLFNRKIRPESRRAIATELARLVDLEMPAPTGFDGVPVLNNLNSWFFPWEKDRDPQHMDKLWSVFAASMEFVDTKGEQERAAFQDAFDAAMGQPQVAWNLTFGLYWIRPWSLLSLDQNVRQFLTHKLRVPLAQGGGKHRCTGADYLALLDNLDSRFAEQDYPVHSYPELSYAAWQYQPPAPDVAIPPDDDEVDDDRPKPIGDVEALPSYSIAEIIRDGCFVPRADLDTMLGQLGQKKNLILQGPPGTGKTWLAKRLAFALMGERDERRVRAVQFHPNLAYEEFVRGWRPSGEGKLTLVDGVFMQAVDAAAKEPMRAFVVVIEEINRGNPAQIFGEFLTLIEAGKRTPNEALELCYPDADGTRRPVHVPENLFVIGTMNIADRSLALVDLALRRRFAFVTLEPRIDETWMEWVIGHCKIERQNAERIRERALELNQRIAGDVRLGPQFRIGHSYVTPPYALETGADIPWFRTAVETEIGPLLDEYWFDRPDEAERARARLLEGW